MASPNSNKPKYDWFFAGTMILVAWGSWTLERFTDFRISRSGDNPPPMSYLFPVIGTPVILIGFYWRWRRAVGIVENGVNLDAAIVKFGFAQHGSQVVTLSYSLDGKSYSARIDLHEAEIAGRTVGDTVSVVVDRRNPKRIIPKFS